MSNLKSWLIKTERLSIVIPECSKTEIEFLLNLWRNPKVMTFVGFPSGLKIDYEKIEQQLSLDYETEFDKVLLVKLSATNQIIGQCKLGSPDKDNIANTDIKLAPQFWGNKYGVEIKRALLDYLFKNTSCDSVKGDPNKLNKASIKMQEAVEGIKVREEIYEFPENMRSYTVNVHSFIYLVSRESWENNN